MILYEPLQIRVKMKLVRFQNEAGQQGKDYFCSRHLLILHTHITMKKTLNLICLAAVAVTLFLLLPYMPPTFFSTLFVVGCMGGLAIWGHILYKPAANSPTLTEEELEELEAKEGEKPLMVAAAAVEFYPAEGIWKSV